MSCKNIDVIRSEVMLARIRKTTFTAVEVILIAYALFWLLALALTNSYTTLDCYTILGDILTKPILMLLLAIVSITMILAGITKKKWLRYVSLMLSTAFWILVSTSIFLEALNMRSANIILAVASAYQCIDIAKGRWSL